jgi:hypothetical protein
VFTRAVSTALVTTALIAGCDKGETQAPSSAASVSAPAASVEPPHSPPFQRFVFEPWKSGRKDIAPVAPPESLLAAWRVFVNQEKPRQKKNPQWRSIPPKDAVELEMEPGTAFRCIVNPLEVQARPTEDDDGVDAWVLTRKILCSGDGWKTWTESPHQVVVPKEGKVTRTIEQTEVLLREPLGDKTRETTILMRSDEKH